MDEIIFIILLICLINLAFEDFQERMISLSGLIMIMGLILIRICLKEDIFFVFHLAKLNFFFILLQLIIIWFFFSLKSGEFINITKSHLGWGDILFFLPLCLLFSPIDFVLFYTLSLILILIVYLFLKQFFLSKINTIPLAGGQSILLILVLAYAHLYQINLYHHSIFYTLF